MSGARGNGAIGEELVLAHFSMRTASLRERAAAAAAAGYSGFSLWIGEYRRLRDCGWRPTEVAAVVAEAGVDLREIEVLQGWCDADSGPRLAEEEQLAYELADATGARVVQTIGSVSGADLDARGLDRLGRLCDRAALHGLVVALEFVPFTNVPDAATACEVVATVGRPNLGVTVDVWHHERGAADLAAVATIPAERVVSLQLNDGPVVPVDADYKRDCMANRLPPGAGEFRIRELVTTLEAAGASPSVSVEVINHGQEHRSPAEVAAALFRATRKALAR
jgi:sugar phosphate isomerase/epimerase